MSALSQLQEALINIIYHYHYISTAEEPQSDLSQEHQFIATPLIETHLKELIIASTNGTPEDRPLLDKICSNIEEVNVHLIQNKPIQTEQLEPLGEKLFQLLLEFKTICASPKEPNSIHKALIDLIRDSFPNILCQSKEQICQYVFNILENYQCEMENKKLRCQLQELLNENGQLKLQNALLKEQNADFIEQLKGMPPLTTPPPKSHQRIHCFIAPHHFTPSITRGLLENKLSESTEPSMRT